MHMEDPAHSATTAGPKRKRPNPDDSQESSPLSTSTQLDITRSADFWFDDGTIILEVETTQFRVHRTILSTHSSFFSDMFKIPQPQNEILVEGCPVISMHDVAEDWENILMVMYQPLKVHPLSPNLSTKCLLSMLRLGRKYQFDIIYDSALTRLKSELPSNLIDYDDLAHRMHIDAEICPSNGNCHAMACRTWNLFELINAAVDLKIEVVLPVAYYLACAKDIPVMLHGSVAPDGTVIRLHPHLQEILLVGRDNVRRAIMTDIYPWVFGQLKKPVPSKECKKPGACSLIFSATTKGTAFEAMVDVDFALGHFQILETLCRECYRTAKASQSESRAKIWNGLPLCFKLQNWDILRAQ